MKQRIHVLIQISDVRKQRLTAKRIRLHTDSTTDPTDHNACTFTLHLDMTNRNWMKQLFMSSTNQFFPIFLPNIKVVVTFAEFT